MTYRQSRAGITFYYAPGFYSPSRHHLKVLVPGHVLEFEILGPLATHAWMVIQSDVTPLFRIYKKHNLVVKHIFIQALV